MQVVTEGLALYSFRDMRNATEEPLLSKLLTYVSRDEARHTGYGIKYLSHVVPTLSDAERAELEDFAFEAARLLIDSRARRRRSATACSASGSYAGLDPGGGARRADREGARLDARGARAERRPRRPRARLRDPHPALDRPLQPAHPAHFEEIFTANFGPAMGDLAQDAVDLPADLEAWVNEGAEE